MKPVRILSRTRGLIAGSLSKFWTAEASVPLNLLRFDATSFAETSVQAAIRANRLPRSCFR